MRIPEVLFNETPSLGAPINTNSSSRVAIVGEFTRGPLSTVLLSEFNDFARIYGYDTGIANLSFQAAYDQGAREFGIKRVIGNSIPPKVDLYVGGVATKANSLTLNFKYVGQPISSTTSFIETFIQAQGSYTGLTDKRYVFRVTQGPATLKATYNQTTSAINITVAIVDATKIAVGSKVTSVTSGILNSNVTVIAVNTVTGVITLSATALQTGVAGYTAFIFENKAVLKWIVAPISQYASLNNLPTINWGITSTDIPSYTDTNGIVVSGAILSTALDLIADAGIVKAIDEGISLKFSSVGIPIEVYPNEQFTIRVNSTEYIIPIAESSTASDIINNIQDIVGGLSPVGIINRLPNEAGTEINLSEDLVSQPLEFFDLVTPDRVTISSGYSFWVDLDTPDGQVALTATGTIATNTITVNDASNIFLSAIVTGVGIAQSTIITNIAGNVLTLSNNLTQTITAGPITIINPNGINFSNYGSINKTGFSNTSNPARNAFVTTYTADGFPLIRFTAISPGQWGNNVVLNIASTGTSTFDVIIEDLNTNTSNSQVESFSVDLRRDIDASGRINSIASTYVNADYLPATIGTNLFPAQIITRTPQRLAPANTFITDVTDIRHINYVGNNKLTKIFLQKGYDGPLPTEIDYVTAVKSLAEERVNFIVVGSLLGANTAVRQAQISVANNSGELEGRKIAILTSTKSLTFGQAKLENAGINTERAVYIAGWATYGGGANNGRFNVPLAAFYAGKLGYLPENISPAARTSAGPIQGVIETDLDQYKSIAAKQLFVDQKVDMISIDPALSGYYVLTGRTMANATGKDEISIVRVYDRIRKDLYFNLQSYKGENNTRTIRAKISSAISAYMDLMSRSGFILGYDQPQIDGSNNPDSAYYTGDLNIGLSYQPLQPIRRIIVTLTRNVSGSVSVN